MSKSTGGLLWGSLLYANSLDSFNPDERNKCNDRLGESAKVSQKRNYHPGSTKALNEFNTDFCLNREKNTLRLLTTVHRCW